MPDIPAKNAAIANWRQPFARPIVAAVGLVLVATVVSLLALVYLSWASSQRLDPLEHHLQHLQNLHAVSIDIQTALVDEAANKNPADAQDVEKISLELRNMLRADGYLHKATPERILAAQHFLVRDGYSIQDNLAAANMVMQKTLKDESEVQRAAIAQTRSAARREFDIALFSLFAVPIVLLAMLLFYRRRFFRWSTSLSQMLENVRNSNLDPVAEPDPNDPIFPVIDHYNAMVARLREIEVEHSDKRQDLEHQVQVASDSLLRVQRNLAQAEQLSALGEFSARVAHELRNPLSGITVALQNLRVDITAPDKLETVDLVLAELDRIKRLLNSLLAKTPNEREVHVTTSVADLCRDMVTLFSYESDRRIEFEVDVPDRECTLPQDSLRQAILNILRNSAQAMGDAGGRIAVTGTIEDDRFRLAIEDTGPGYPEDILRHGIRPFRTDKEGGSGLGLSILQRLIQNAGGTLHLENAETGGARTIIELPCHGCANEE